VAKPRTTPKDAKKVTVSLTPEAQLAVQAIASRRRKRGVGKDSRDEIIDEAIWHLLTEVEKVPRHRIDEIVPPIPEEPKQSNLARFPKKKGFETPDK
jgi:hypothetical protein